MRRALLPVLVAGASVLLVACVDDGPDAASRPVPVTSVATSTPAASSTTPATATPATATPATASTTTVPEPAAPNGLSVRVQSLDNSFRPEVIEVSAGTEVVWTNDGRNDHDVIPSDGSDEWGVAADLFAPGDEYRHVFTLPGEYPYYCSIHGTAEFGMLGTVVVTG